MGTHKHSTLWLDWGNTVYMLHVCLFVCFILFCVCVCVFSGEGLLVNLSSYCHSTEWPSGCSRHPPDYIKEHWLDWFPFGFTPDNFHSPDCELNTLWLQELWRLFVRCVREVEAGLQFVFNICVGLSILVLSVRCNMMTGVFTLWSDILFN